MNKEAKNMEVIYKAKKHHDATCVYGGTGVRVLMSPFDIERMGWEEGDVIAGLTLVADGSRQAGYVWVECDAEPKSDENIEEQIRDLDLVST